MSIFKQATREKLRFVTSKGNLTTEQLWDLSISELDSLAVAAQIETDTSTKKSLLKKKSTVDKIAQLKFEVLQDILLTKDEEREVAQSNADKKAHNEKILRLVQEKDDAELASMSKEELMKQLQ